MAKRANIFQLAGRWPGKKRPTAWCYAMAPQDLPRGGWYALGAEHETVRRVRVSQADPRVEAALVASSPKPIWPTTSTETTTSRPEGAISNETMRRAIEISRSVDPDGHNANFWLFGITPKKLERARVDVENGFRRAGFDIPPWPPETS